MLNNGSGRQVNLDNGEGQILRGFLTDDIFSCSSFLEIVFETNKKCVFGADINYYFTYYNIDWIPLRFSESTGLNHNWHYELIAVPKSLFTLVTKPARNTMEFARALKLNLTIGSSALKIPCPTIYQYAGNLIQDMRLHSFEQAIINNDLGSAMYAYVGTKEMLSVTWKTLISKTATIMEFSPYTAGADKIVYQDDQIEKVFSTAKGCDVWKQKDYISKMIGTHFTIHTASPAIFLNVYSMKFSDIPEFDTGLPYLCIYSRKDVMDANSFVHTFANIKYIR